MPSSSRIQHLSHLQACKAGMCTHVRWPTAQGKLQCLMPAACGMLYGRDSALGPLKSPIMHLQLAESLIFMCAMDVVDASTMSR